jgi:hypothetical protein
VQLLKRLKNAREKATANLNLNDFLLLTSTGDSRQRTKLIEGKIDLRKLMFELESLPF